MILDVTMELTQGVTELEVAISQLNLSWTNPG